MKKVKIKKEIIDKLPFEVGVTENGEGFIELSDEEAMEVIKKLCQDEKILQKHFDDLTMVFESELQSYAEDQYNRFGRGEFFEDLGEK